MVDTTNQCGQPQPDGLALRATERAHAFVNRGLVAALLGPESVPSVPRARTGPTSAARQRAPSSGQCLSHRRRRWPEKHSNVAEFATLREMQDELVAVGDGTSGPAVTHAREPHKAFHRSSAFATATPDSVGAA